MTVRFCSDDSWCFWCQINVAVYSLVVTTLRTELSILLSQNPKTPMQTCWSRMQVHLWFSLGLLCFQMMKQPKRQCRLSGTLKGGWRVSEHQHHWFLRIKVLHFKQEKWRTFIFLSPFRDLCFSFDTDTIPASITLDQLFLPSFLDAASPEFQDLKISTAEPLVGFNILFEEPFLV